MLQIIYKHHLRLPQLLSDKIQIKLILFNTVQQIKTLA